jgi:hypothetical protein
MDKTDWKELVGKRCLVETKRWVDPQEEFVVVEVSPAGRYIKLRDRDGERWFSKWKIELLEVLDT